jgi:2-methylfumaryl-CoA isomerase
MVAGISASQWTALCKACELDASFAEMDDAKRFEARETIAAKVEAWCLKRDFAEVERVFNLNKVCWGRYRTVSDLIANDPRVSLTNPVFERVDTPGIGEHLTAGARYLLWESSANLFIPLPGSGNIQRKCLRKF